MSTSALHPEPAGRSTGPRTATGKAKSSQNAVRHGCCSKSTLFLADETPEDRVELERDCLASYDVSTPIGKQLALQVAEELWQLRRIERQHDNVVQKLYSQKPNMADWQAEDHKEFTLVRRYLTAAGRSHHRAVTAADRHLRTGILEKQRADQERKTDAIVTRNLAKAELDRSKAELNRAKAAAIRASLPPDSQPEEQELFESDTFNQDSQLGDLHLSEGEPRSRITAEIESLLRRNRE